MEPKYLIFLCTVCGALLAAPIGAIFGAFTAHVTHRAGRAAGSIVGRTVAEAFARVSEGGMSPARVAILVGAADGAIFLAVLGALVGVWVGWRGNFQPAFLLTITFALLALPLLAAVFGLFAYCLGWLGTRVLGIVCTTSILGALVAFQLAGTSGILLGVLAGCAAGMLLGIILRGR